jgi:hypothetical protein
LIPKDLQNQEHEQRAEVTRWHVWNDRQIFMAANHTVTMRCDFFQAPEDQ